MDSDLAKSIILTMAPIVVLMIGLIVYGLIRNGKQKSSQSKRETDAIIEAQAMLAKYQKEQQNKSEEKSESEKKPKENKPEEEAKSDKKEEKSEKKPQKPSVEAPVKDTTELEPDIDKSTNE